MTVAIDFDPDRLACQAALRQLAGDQLREVVGNPRGVRHRSAHRRNHARQLDSGSHGQ